MERSGGVRITLLWYQNTPHVCASLLSRSAHKVPRWKLYTRRGGQPLPLPPPLIAGLACAAAPRPPSPPLRAAEGQFWIQWPLKTQMGQREPSGTSIVGSSLQSSIQWPGTRQR